MKQKVIKILYLYLKLTFNSHWKLLQKKKLFYYRTIIVNQI